LTPYFKCDRIPTSVELTHAFETWVQPTSSNICSYQPALGDETLRESIRIKLQVPEHLDVIVTQGATHGLALLWNAFGHLYPALSWTVEEPCHFGMLRYLKADPIKGQVTQELSIANAANNIVYTTTRFHSHLLADKTVATVKSWNARFVIEDNPYDLTSLSAKPISYSLDNVITLGSFSKVFGPGLRCGYILLPKHLTSTLKSQLITQDLCGSVLVHSLCTHLLNANAHIAQAQLYLKANKLLHNTRYLKINPLGGTTCVFSPPAEEFNIASEWLNNLQIPYDINKHSYFDNVERPYLRFNFTLTPEAIKSFLS